MRWILQFETADDLIAQEFFDFPERPWPMLRRQVRKETNWLEVNESLTKIEPMKTRIYRLEKFDLTRLTCVYKEEVRT